MSNQRFVLAGVVAALVATAPGFASPIEADAQAVGHQHGRRRGCGQGRGRRAAAVPAGYSVDIVRDNSEQIRTSTHEVLEHLVIGSLLASLVVLLFLRQPALDADRGWSRSLSRSSRRSA